MKRERPPSLDSETKTESDLDVEEESVGVKSEDPVPSPAIVPTLNSSASAPTLPPPQPPPPPMQSSQSASLPPIGNRFAQQEPPRLDEHAKRHRQEAEEMARKLEKRPNYSCGVNYSGDEEEKRFSDGFKNDIKVHLPSLKNHKLIFHYMAWATRERLECDHCRKCTNKFR